MLTRQHPEIFNFGLSNIECLLDISIAQLIPEDMRGPDFILRFAKDKEASDPRDLVYGLSNLLSLNHGIEPDYSLSVRDVYLHRQSAL